MSLITMCIPFLFLLFLSPPSLSHSLFLPLSLSSTLTPLSLSSSLLHPSLPPSLCLQVVTKHPLEADLSRCSLNCLPKYLFLNKNLAALNLSHNFMLERVEDATVSPQPEGWINDIYRFANLKILSLSDNNLVHFPVPVCNIVTLSELDLSCNRIRVIPQDIQKLKK